MKSDALIALVIIVSAIILGAVFGYPAMIIGV
jgi:hypothetical protein